MIAIAPGANETVGAADVEAAGLQGGDYVLLQHEVPLATVEAPTPPLAPTTAITRPTGLVSGCENRPQTPRTTSSGWIGALPMRRSPDSSSTATTGCTT